MYLLSIPSTSLIFIISDSAIKKQFSTITPANVNPECVPINILRHPKLRTRDSIKPQIEKGTVFNCNEKNSAFLYLSFCLKGSKPRTRDSTKPQIEKRNNIQL